MNQIFKLTPSPGTDSKTNLEHSKHDLCPQDMGLATW